MKTSFDTDPGSSHIHVLVGMTTSFLSGSRINAHPCAVRDEGIQPSLADAEGGKDRTQQILAGERAGDLAERTLRGGEFLGHELGGRVRLSRTRGGQVPSRALQCENVAGARA